MNAEPVRMRSCLVRGTGRIGLAVVATLLMSACAAGQQAQTAEESATLDGVNKSVGDIALRGLAIAAPVGSAYYLPGSDAELKLVIVNTGSQSDTLTSITSTAVTGWGSFPSSAQAKAVQSADGSAAATAGPSASGSSAASSSPASSPAAGPSSTTANAPQGSRAVDIAAGGRTSFGVPETKSVLLLLKTIGKLYPGSSIDVTFTFARAGSVTVTVPIQLSASPGTETIKQPSGSVIN